MAKKVKKIDVYQRSHRIWPLFALVIHIFSYIQIKKAKEKIIKSNKIPKPPYILISNHSAFMDIYAGQTATFKNRSYWVCAIEEFIDKYFVCIHSGIVPKRRFTNDPRSISIMLEVLNKRKKILVVYPEAKYTFVGKPERIDKGIGYLAKLAKVPVVYMNCHGHYLRDPQWGDHVIRDINPLVAEMRCLISKKQVIERPLSEINEVIESAFDYDEEQYQLDNNIKINYPKRAEGLQHILYKCPHCGKEYEMSTSGDTITCDKCHISYRLNEDGTLSCIDKQGKFNKVSDWYYWQKEEVRQEVNDGTYHFEDDVIVRHLEGVKIGFKQLEGHYHLTHDIKDGFNITGDDGFKYNRSSLQSYALHIEFNYKGMGNCIDFVTNEETYFVSPTNKKESLMKLYFATEIIYDKLKEELR